MDMTSEDVGDVVGMSVMTHTPWVVIEMRGGSRLGNSILNSGTPSATHVRFLRAEILLPNRLELGKSCAKSIIRHLIRMFLGTFPWMCLKLSGSLELSVVCFSGSTSQAFYSRT
jgi:hypothetical protein